MKTIQNTLLIATLLIRCASAQDVIGLPFGAENPAITVSAAGTGTNGFTTYIGSATSLEPNFPFPTITFIESGSVIIIPTATFAIPIDVGKSEKVVLYESCSVGQGGVANCLVSEQIALDGSTLGSAVTQTPTISFYTLNASPSSGNGASQSGSASSQSPSGSNTPSTPQSTSADSTTGSPTASTPTTSGTGAASKFEAQVGLAVLLSSLLMFL